MAPCPEPTTSANDVQPKKAGQASSLSYTEHRLPPSTSQPPVTKKRGRPSKKQVMVNKEPRLDISYSESQQLVHRVSTRSGATHKY